MPRYFVFYELSSVAALTSPQYLAAYYLTSEAVAEDETFRQAIETTWRKGQGDAPTRFAILGCCIYSVAAKEQQ